MGDEAVLLVDIDNGSGKPFLWCEFNVRHADTWRHLLSHLWGERRKGELDEAPGIVLAQPGVIVHSGDGVGYRSLILGRKLGCPTRRLQGTHEGSVDSSNQFVVG